MKLPINGDSNGSERVGWEYHNIALSRVPVYGFGIAVSGGRDNPHFMNGDPSIAISDVLRAGPAEGKLLVISANGISLENVDYSQAIHVLRECGNSVNLLIKRRALVSATNNSQNNSVNSQHQSTMIPQPQQHIGMINAVDVQKIKNQHKITLTKNNKKDDFGVILGCKIYVKEIVNKNSISKDSKDNLNGDGTLQEGDIIQKINDTSTDNLTLKDAKKLFDNCKDLKLTLIIERDVPSLQTINQNFLNENGNYINGHNRSNSNLSSSINSAIINNNTHQQHYNHNQNVNKWNSNDERNGQDDGGQIKQDNRKFHHNAAGSSSSFTNSVPNSRSGFNHSYSSSISAIASNRVASGNGWSNQNVYVQPPTRNDSSLMNVPKSSNFPTENETNRLSDLNRSNLRESIRQSSQSFDPESRPVNDEQSMDSKTTLSHRPLPQKPSNYEASKFDLNNNNKSIPSTMSRVGEDLDDSFTANSMKTFDDGEKQYDNENSELIPRNSSSSITNEIRCIAFKKEGSVGIRLTGGNEVGIFVTAVQPGSPAFQQGLQVGDKILKANQVDMKNFTREEAVLYLLKIKDRIELYVQNCKDEYESIVAKQKGDSFYIRVHFNFDSEGKGELSFHAGDLFHVVDTLFNGVVGSWFVYRLGRNNQEIQKGSIPNQSRADELASEQCLEKKSLSSSTSGTDLNLTVGSSSSKRSSFFKRRRSARRSKSLCRDHWDDIVFGNSSTKFKAYERVTFRHPGFIRPIIFFGPLADIAREKLIRDSPEKFASPQNLSSGDDCQSKNSKLPTHSGIVRLTAIKEIINQGKHALLDITPNAVDRLNYAQFYPIVIFMRSESKAIVKELRSRSSTKQTVHRSSRKLFDQSIKLEKVWHHIFTSSMQLTSGGDLWYKKLQEIIEKQQQQSIWMSEFKPNDIIDDDFLFPMNSISRLSYASSPESDLDISANESKTFNNDDEDIDPDARSKEYRGTETTGCLKKSSSDPNIVKAEESLIINKNEVETFASPSKTDKVCSKETNDLDPSTMNSAKSLPLHVLLNNELTKTFADNKLKSEMLESQSNKNPNDDMSNYSTLKIEDKLTQGNGHQQSSVVSKEQLPTPRPISSTLLTDSKINSQFLETPPRIDRNNKPSRFRSAHERLFGVDRDSSLSNHQTKESTSTFRNQNHYHMTDDSDYINTNAFECSTTKSLHKFSKNYDDINNNHHKTVYNMTSSKSSAPLQDGTRRANPISIESESSKKSNQTNFPEQECPAKALPPFHPIHSVSKLEQTKTPPSPPPKPILNRNAVNGYNSNNSEVHQSMQYQMASMNLNDSRQVSMQKSYASSTSIDPPPLPSHHNPLPNFSDYDNMPPIYPLKVLPKKGVPAAIENTLANEMMNGPPGYYQSVPRSIYPPPPIPSSYGQQQSTLSHKPDTYQRYSSQQAETISNFINGTSNTYSSSDHQFDSIQSNDNTYLNFPFNSRTFENPVNYLTVEDNNHPSPLPPPPLLHTASYHSNNLNVQQQLLSRSNNLTPNLIQPTPQPPPSIINSQRATSGGQYFDISLNRDNRRSAFEIYRKPTLVESSGNPSTVIQQGLPPPPTPLSINDYK
ncbi:tight junction protein ZO-1-like protein [Sarcoptes scabiei]|uniref:Tight junction protein ZO-1-like protein n=1 Tax=Sarcoptes scabiei TaxID=52283 RepID=A0A131ZT67_SARSC|nr:tight junction protein ZO-1-like protein [Sarcoptes scabiei]